MDTTQQFLAKYKALTQQSLDKYMSMYREAHPQNRDIETARVFMDEHYEDYRKEVARIAIDTMHEAGISNHELNKQIVEHNPSSIGALFGEIMRDSLNQSSSK